MFKYSEIISIAETIIFRTKTINNNLLKESKKARYNR